MSKLMEILQKYFSVENYALYVTDLKVSPNMQSMLIGCYSNLLSVANDESNPNQDSAFMEIIKQYYAVINVPKIEILNNQIEELNDQIKKLQTQLDDKNVEIANLQYLNT